MSFMLSVANKPFMISAIMLKIIMLSITMLNVMAQFGQHSYDSILWSRRHLILCIDQMSVGQMFIDPKTWSLSFILHFLYITPSSVGCILNYVDKQGTKVPGI